MAGSQRTVTVTTSATVIIPAGGSAGYALIVNGGANRILLSDGTYVRAGGRRTLTLTGAVVTATAESATASVTVIDERETGSRIYTATPDLQVVSESWVPGEQYPRRRSYAGGLPDYGDGTAAPVPGLFDWSEALTAGQVVPQRAGAYTNTGNTLTLTSQLLTLTFFRACRTEVVSTVTSVTGATVAAATPSLIQFGLYTEAANGDITLVASTPTDLTLFTVVNGANPKAFSTPYTLVRGQRYCGGWLVVTAATAPNIRGFGVGGAGNQAENIRPPKVAGVFTGQATLPAGVVGGPVTGSGALAYFALT